MELISVIVPIYNIEQYVESCLDSISKQTYTNIEVIIVDDGSTDNSGKICDKLACYDERFFVFHKKHEGLSSARNYGIDKAKGEYIVFIDGDDQVDSSLIEHLYGLVKDKKSQIGICDFAHCYNADDIEYKSENIRKIYKPNDAVIEMLYQKSFLVSACAKIYQTDLFQDIKFPRGMVFEDAAVMYKVFEKARWITYSNARLYAYIHKGNSITTKKFSDSNLDILIVSKKIMSHYKNGDIKIRRAAYTYFINSCMRIFLNAPRKKQFMEQIAYCEHHINKGRWKCLINPKVRIKLKLALLLFTINHRLLFRIYKKVDRWS